MKKYFMMAFAAIAAMTVTVSCDSDFEPSGFYSEIIPSTSYVSLDVNSGSSTFSLTTSGDWTIQDIPTWLTVSPTFGSAGTSRVTVSADSTLDGRSAALKILCDAKAQYINVVQGLSKISTATCAEVLAGPDSKTYQIKGTVTDIANTVYGNFYINDGTGVVYIYGTLFDGKTQNNPIVNNKIEVGDEVIVQGPKTTFNTTVELVDVTVIQVNKSLIKCDSTYVAGVNTNVLPCEGGDITAYFTNKGQGIYVNIPEEFSSWISISEIAGDKVTFHVAENVAGPRAAAFVVRTSDGKKEYSANVELSQDGLSGTLELPMTVAEAIDAAKSGATKPVYVKGIVSELVSGGFGAQYGNGSFWISADGVYNNDLSLDFEAYQVNWLGNGKWTAENPQIEVGAEVILYGPLTFYNGTTAETQGRGAAYVYSINGVTTDANGIGTTSAPFNALGGIEAAKAKVSVKVYVQGIVSELVKGGFDANYGNGSFWISTDGKFNNDKSLDFEAYQVNWLEGQKWNAETNPQIAVGDKVVLYGPLTTYSGTSETQGKGAAYVFSYTPAN